MLGVYVHFPWCRARCPYCDFAIAVAPLAEIPHRRYADAVLEELAVRVGRFAGETLVSIYFGGGTPALWDPAELARVRAAVAGRFDHGDLEVTVEANPNDCTPERLAALRAAGANRLSIGTQAFGDAELVVLGRDHDAAAGAAAVIAARAAGFENVSLDLICALPLRGLRSASPPARQSLAGPPLRGLRSASPPARQSLAGPPLRGLRSASPPARQSPAGPPGRRDFGASVERAVALAPEHMSVYQLTIEERTPFGQAAREGRLIPPPDEEAAADFELAHARLEAAGYEHYEVSAYARPGRRAVHNQLYWSGASYLGLGNGAHSFWTDGTRGLRWSGHRSVSRWLAGTPDADLRRDGRIAEHSEEDAAAVAADRLWLGMRTTDGVPLADAPAAALPALVAAGLVTTAGGRLRPTPRGLLFADEVGARLLAEVE